MDDLLDGEIDDMRRALIGAALLGDRDALAGALARVAVAHGADAELAVLTRFVAWLFDRAANRYDPDAETNPDVDHNLLRQCGREFLEWSAHRLAQLAFASILRSMPAEPGRG